MAGKDNIYNDNIRDATVTGTTDSKNKYAAFVPIPIVLSFILLLVGFVTPWWMCMKINGVFYGSGLWYYVLCPTGTACKTKAFDELTDAAENELVKYRVMASLALVFQILATISVLLARIPKTNFKRYLFTFMSICGFCLFLSAIFSLVTSGMFAHKVIEAYNLYKKYEFIMGDSPYMFPYSLFLFGIGGIVSALTMCFIVGTFCSKRVALTGQGWRPYEMS